MSCSFPFRGKAGMGARGLQRRADSEAACPHPNPPPGGEGAMRGPPALSLERLRLSCSFPFRGKVGMGARGLQRRADSEAACPHPGPPPGGEGAMRGPPALSLERLRLSCSFPFRGKAGMGARGLQRRADFEAACPLPGPPPGGEGAIRGPPALSLEQPLLSCSFPFRGKAGMGARGLQRRADSEAARPHPGPPPGGEGAMRGPPALS
jgi:hypothetical protein